MEEEKIKKEEFSVSGKDVVKKVKELIKAGNVRKIIIKRENGKTIMEVPLTIGVVGVALLPILGAIGAVAALLTQCTIIVEKTEEQK